MASSIDYITKLESLRWLVLDDSNDTDFSQQLCEIEKLVGCSVPIIAGRILYHYQQISEMYRDIFLGFDALSLENVVSMYKDKENPYSFFSQYHVDEMFNVDRDRYIVIEEYRDQGKVDDSVIYNVGHLMPLFKFQTDYITLDLRKEKAGELMIITYGHLANILAPNIFEHIDDLIGGLKRSIYHVINGDLIYAPMWENRKKIQAGELVVDRYGQVSKPIAKKM